MSSIRYKTLNGSFETALSGLGELQSLAEECREIVDNASEGLAQTQRIQTMGETADALENIETDIDVPDSLTDEVISWTEAEPNRKNRGLSRSNRRNNAIAGAQAVAEQCREIEAEDEPEEPTRNEGESDRDWEERFHAWENARTEWETRTQDASELADTIEQLISEVDSVEFPGMYG